MFYKVARMLLESDVFHDNFEYVTSYEYSKLIVEEEEGRSDYIEYKIVSGHSDDDLQYIRHIESDKLQEFIKDGEWVERTVVRGSAYTYHTTSGRKFNIGNGEYIGVQHFKPQGVYIVKKPEYLEDTFLGHDFVKVLLKVNMGFMSKDTKNEFGEFFTKL